MTYHIETRTLTAQDTAVVRASMPVGQLPGWLAGVFDEVYRHLTERGIPVDGPPFARYAFHGDLVDVEAGFPVPAPVPDGRRVVASRLPGGPVAVTEHDGPYEGLALAYQAVAGWLKAADLEPAGPHWEVYYTDPATEPDPATARTDVVTPYRPG